MTTFRVDYENNAESFWEELQARVGGAFSEPIVKLLTDEDVELDEPEAGQFTSFLAELPGWADPDSPRHAPHPVVID